MFPVVLLPVVWLAIVIFPEVLLPVVILPVVQLPGQSTNKPYFQIEGDWNLIEYMSSFDGKPVPPHNPYLCPESRLVFEPSRDGQKMNISQVNRDLT